MVGDAGIKIQRQPTKWIATKQQIKYCPIKNHVIFLLLMFRYRVIILHANVG